MKFDTILQEDFCIDLRYFSESYYFVLVKLAR